MPEPSAAISAASRLRLSAASSKLPPNLMTMFTIAPRSRENPASDSCFAAFHPFGLVGQDGILRRLGKPPQRRVNNPPQVDNLPHKSDVHNSPAVSGKPSIRFTTALSRNPFWLVGQDGILRRLGKPPQRRVNNPPQVGNLPYKARGTGFSLCLWTDV